MENIAKTMLETKIKGLTGLFFQSSIESVMQIIYEHNFQPIKQKRDKGCDGIIDKNTILALYAPERYLLRDFKSKVGLDYKSYQKNWLATHPHWIVVCNCDVTAEMHNFIKSLHSDSQIWGVNQLTSHISSVNWSKKTKIFRALDIQDRFLTIDVVKMVVEDLIQSSDEGIMPPYQRPAYITDKANLNMPEDDVPAFLEEYEECLSVFSLVKLAIREHDTNQIRALRSKIRNLYGMLSGEFLGRFEFMIKELSGEKFSDDIYVSNLRVVLIYFFEQCLFGKRTANELANA